MDNTNTSENSTNDKSTPKTNKVKSNPGVLSVKISEDDWKMVLALKAHPHYTNLSQYFRNCLKHLYDSKFNKPSKVSKPTPTTPNPASTESTTPTNPS